MIINFSETNVTHFITQVSFSFSVTAITLVRLVVGRMILCFYVPAGTTTETFDFTVPIKTSENTINLYWSPDGAAGDNMAGNIYGWYEKQ